MPSPINILVVDDHAMVRLGLCEGLQTQDDFHLAGAVASGREALEFYADNAVDVVISDYRMPGMTGAQLTSDLIKHDPAARVLVLSVYSGEEDIFRAARAGASGYLSKAAGMEAIYEAVRALASGKNYFPIDIQKKLASRASRAELTPREKQVLGLLARGMSNKEIMSALGLSQATVKLHVSNVLSKLEVDDRTQAVLAAVKRGIVHLDD